MDKDSDLFHQIKQGKKQSFEQLFRANYVPLCMFARQFVHDKDECEEIVQSFFTSLWEKRAHIEIKTSAKNYLYSSIRNRCLNHIKHLKIRTEYQEAMNYLKDNSSATENFIEPDLLHKIYQSINELPEKRREIFVLSREHGLKYREIAEKLNISVKTVEAQMGHALRELRHKLKSYKHLIISFLTTYR